MWFRLKNIRRRLLRLFKIQNKRVVFLFFLLKVVLRMAWGGEIVLVISYCKGFKVNQIPWLSCLVFNFIEKFVLGRGCQKPLKWMLNFYLIILMTFHNRIEIISSKGTWLKTDELLLLLSVIGGRKSLKMLLGGWQCSGVPRWLRMILTFIQ